MTGIRGRAIEDLQDEALAHGRAAADAAAMTDRLPAGYIGLWRLQPDLCDYAFGVPPAHGSYRIQLDPASGVVTLEARSFTRSGRQRGLTVAGRLDALPRPVGGSALAQQISMWISADGAFCSAAWRGGRRVQWAERRLTDEGLVITVHGSRSDGSAYANSDHYRQDHH